ncbi:MAG: hypothetical protein AAGI03_13070 [Pseudomonadota bacterium]
MALSDDEVLCILAFVTAECLPVGSAMVENLGVQLEVNMQDHWQPDQAFLDLMRDKTAINAMLAEIAGEDTAAAHITATAKTGKAIIKACLDGTREAKDAAWHPRYMRFPMEAYTDKGRHSRHRSVGCSERTRRGMRIVRARPPPRGGRASFQL